MPINTEVIETRLAMLAEHLSDLNALHAITFDEYRANKILRGYVERTLQVCVQICLDIGHHLVAECGFRVPEDNKDIFVVLHEEGILSTTLLPTMLNMTGFRNIIVHDYTRVADAIVYGILMCNLGDLEQYAAAIVAFLYPNKRVEC